MELDKALVIGGSGMVGSQIPFGEKPSHAELDITDGDSVRRAFDTYRPTAVLHLAGMIDVKRCEEDPSGAERSNVAGAALVADAVARADIPVVYFSSCMVFDGEKGEPYVESDTPNPRTVYGKTKYRGEQEVLARAPKAIVARTGWLFGGRERDTKFVKRFVDSLRARKPVRATNDRFGSPTYVPNLIEAVAGLLQKGERGIFHVVNDGIASYFEVAQELKRLTGSVSEVAGLTQKELNPSEAPRGSMEALASNRGVALRPYREALAEYVASLGGTASRI